MVLGRLEKEEMVGTGCCEQIHAVENCLLKREYINVEGRTGRLGTHLETEG